MTALLVALGAAVGAPLRYLAGHWLDRQLHWGTLLANLVGSAMLGALFAAAVDGHWLALLGTGFCGGLTTFSTFAVEIVDLVRDDAISAAIAYGVLSVGLSILAVVVGAAALRRVRAAAAPLEESP